MGICCINKKQLMIQSNAENNRTKSANNRASNYSVNRQSFSIADGAGPQEQNWKELSMKNCQRFTYFIYGKKIEQIIKEYIEKSQQNIKNQQNKQKITVKAHLDYQNQQLPSAYKNLNISGNGNQQKTYRNKQKQVYNNENQDNQPQRNLSNQQEIDFLIQEGKQYLLVLQQHIIKNSFFNQVQIISNNIRTIKKSINIDSGQKAIQFSQSHQIQLNLKKVIQRVQKLFLDYFQARRQLQKNIQNKQTGQTQQSKANQIFWVEKLKKDIFLLLNYQISQIIYSIQHKSRNYQYLIPGKASNILVNNFLNNFMKKTNFLCNQNPQINSKNSTNIKNLPASTNTKQENSNTKQKKTQTIEMVSLKQVIYLVKIQVIFLKNLLNLEKQKNKDKLTKNRNIKRLGISVFLDQNQAKWKNTKQLNQQFILKIQEINKNSSQLNADSNQNKTNFVEFIVNLNSILRFKTYPYESTLTLHAMEFLKILYLNQDFQLIRKSELNKTQQSKQNSKTKNKTFNTPSYQQIQYCAEIKLRMQIFSSNYIESVQRLKLYAKNLVNQLQIVKKGQSSWENIHSLKSSFASISENESSFISHNDGGQWCC